MSETIHQNGSPIEPPIQKTILHVDMDAFFAAVEQHDRPELRGKPVIIGSPPTKRGVVSTCSYEARAFGVHSAMPSSIAAQRCPQGIFLPVRMTRYAEASAQIMAVFERFTPLVQPLSCDEAFLDVTGSLHLFGDGEQIARLVKQAVFDETGLTCSVGVAPNLFLAKIASDMDKPDGLTLVPFSADQIPPFLAPLPIKRMWGVGAKTQKILSQRHIYSIGDLQKIDFKQLTSMIGERSATAFHQRAFGIDHRPLVTETEEKSISNEMTFSVDEHEAETVEARLLDLADKVGSRLRKAGFYAKTAHIKIRWGDFTSITRQRRLDPACCDDQSLREVALSLLHKEGVHSPVRLIGFGVSGLCASAESAQLDLFESVDHSESKKREALSRAVDRVREQFGELSLRRASAIDPNKGDSA